MTRGVHRGALKDKKSSSAGDERGWEAGQGAARWGWRTWKAGWTQMEHVSRAVSRRPGHREGQTATRGQPLGHPGCRQQVSRPCRAAPLEALPVPAPPLIWEAVGLGKLGSVHGHQRGQRHPGTVFETAASNVSIFPSRPEPHFWSLFAGDGGVRENRPM